MKPQLPSRAPLVLDKLVELFAAAMASDEALADVEVLDGPFAGPESALPNDVVIVGEGSPDDPGVLSEFVQEPGLGRRAYSERVETIVLVSSYSGDEDMKPRRDRAAAIFAALKAAIDANQNAAKVWDDAALGERTAWYPVQSGSGASCAVGFTVVTRSII